MGPEHRTSPRTNLLLAATLEGGRAPVPVRIRNLSETGALVEGDDLPPQGAIVALRRGGQDVPSLVMWTRGNRCGLHFEVPPPIREWTGGRINPGSFERPAVQPAAEPAPVQATSAQPSSTLASVAASSLAAEPDLLIRRLADELAYVQRLLGSISDELLTEPIVINRHAGTLQRFDLADQILSHVARIITADDPAAAVDSIGMEELRARLKRKAVIGR